MQRIGGDQLRNETSTRSRKALTLRCRYVGILLVLELLEELSQDPTDHQELAMQAKSMI